MPGVKIELVSIIGVGSVFSNANLEAICSGTFLIASNVQGNSDLIKDRITGLFFNLNDKSDLLKQLFTFKNNKKLVQEIIINAKKEVSTNFDIDVVTNKIYKFLNFQGRV